MSRIDAILGKRVVVTRPTPGAEDNCSHWCAGHVPVGSTGTIVPIPDVDCMAQIVWDHGQEPEGDYVFGVMDIGHELKEIEQEDEDKRGG